MEKSCGAFFFSWPQAFLAGVEVVGGKGWNLGRLERYGFKVPAGGVLSAGAYRCFIEENHLRDVINEISKSVTIGNVGEKEIEEKLLLVRERIRSGNIPPHIQEKLISGLKNTEILEKPLAVRSSATAEDASGASFAGIHESFLNIRGIDSILSAIKGCYASLWTPRAIAYRRKMNIGDDEVVPAVVIMEMVEAKSAGVAFTCDPRTGREDVMLISANFGLGESVVSGAVDPDEYILTEKVELADKKIGRKEGMTVAGKEGGTGFIKSENASGQALLDDNIQKLGILVLRIFEAMGNAEQHQDIEWAFDGEHIYLVQSRPVTALPVFTFRELKGQPDLWSNANIKDASPMVQSTLNWSLMRYGLNSLLETPYRVFAYRAPEGLRFAKLFRGRAYSNLSKRQWGWYDAYGMPPNKVNESAGGHQPEIEIKEKKPYAGMRGFRRLFRLLRAILVISGVVKRAGEWFSRVEEFTGGILQKDFGTLCDKELIDISAKNEEAQRAFHPTFMMLAGWEVHVRLTLVNELERMFKGKGNSLANALLVGCGDITSAKHGYRLLELAEMARRDTEARKFFSSDPFYPLLWEKELPDDSAFKQSFRSFLEEYGHRGVYELDIINPRWREDPSYLINIIRNSMENADLTKMKIMQAEKAGRAWQEINRKLPLYRRKYIKYLLRRASKGAELREMSKSVIVKSIELNRIVAQELGKRFAARGVIEEQADIYHCAWVEIVSIINGDWDGRGLKLLVSDRKYRRKELEALAPPDLIIGDAPKYAEPATLTAGNALRGMGAAAGKASGQARLIFHPNEGGKLLPGDVLVAPTTDPGWTPLFLRASAIVMETGGGASHGAIVAREYGIPAVVNISGVMKLIKDGQIITVDGDEGKVYLKV